jgi:hypothetical protein
MNRAYSFIDIMSDTGFYSGITHFFCEIYIHHTSRYKCQQVEKG